MDANKFDNVEEMDKFLEVCDLPTLYNEEIENLNISITNNEIEGVLKKLTEIQKQTV